MFDLADEQFYKDYPKMRYGDWCKASNAKVTMTWVWLWKSTTLA